MNILKTPLRELQVDMQRHLLGEDSTVTAAIVDGPPLPAADRLAIYRNAYQVRLVDALHETYPILHGLLGDEAWVELGYAYIAAHPSLFRSIRWYGRELAEYLAASAPYSEAPILSEVALLEWMLAEVFDAPDAACLPRSALSAIEPAAWSSLTLKFHPSLRRLSFSWNTAAVWKAMSQDKTPPRPEMAPGPVPWLLWRQNLQNYFRSMNAVESAALASALSGRNFAQLCEDLGALLPQEEIPAAAAGLLGAWADGGMITKVGSSDSDPSQ
ncbi:MAG TPA: DNA-binding domain-containing protein [Steroidobacteraceae bacterium]